MKIYLVCNLLVFCVVSVFANSSGNSSIFRESNMTSFDVEEKAIEVLKLPKCPGSNVDVSVNNISGQYFFTQDLESTIMVQFIERNPDCSEESMLTSIKPVLATGKDNAHALYDDGWFLTFHDKFNQESIPFNEYCIMSLEDLAFSVKYCRANCKSKPCLTKCCLADEICHVNKDDKCDCMFNAGAKWVPLKKPFSINHHTCADDQFGKFSVSKFSVNLNSSQKSEFQILENGTVQYLTLHDKRWFTLEPGTYCVDGGGHAEDEETLKFSGNSSDMVLHTCRFIAPREPEDFEFVLHRILIPFAIVFLIITIVVYLLTWPEQTTHGYTIFFYLTTLLLLYIFTVLTTVPAIARPTQNPTGCTFIAKSVHYFYLSSMCWLTSVSFNVWRTFKRMNQSAEINKSRGKKRFILFFMFSFGYPAMQVTACAMLDSIYGHLTKDEAPFIIPHYGDNVCDMSNDGRSYYLYLPIALLVLCNVVFCIATMITMIEYKKSIRQAFEGINRGTSCVADQSFGIYARLFIIMGIVWLSQIIWWFTMRDNTNQSLAIICAITDALTVLQAVATFYIFVCRKNVFENLWHLQPWLRPFLSLWISGGCCLTPPPNLRKCSGGSAVGKGTLKSKVSTDTMHKRNSKDSVCSSHVPTPTSASTNEDLSRKVSAASDITIISGSGSSGYRVSGEPQIGVFDDSETKV